jgi:hypothetical protein
MDEATGQTQTLGAEFSSVVGHLPSTREALGSIPSPAKANKQKTIPRVWNATPKPLSSVLPRQK